MTGKRLGLFYMYDRETVGTVLHMTVMIRKQLGLFYMCDCNKETGLFYIYDCNDKKTVGTVLHV